MPSPSSTVKRASSTVPQTRSPPHKRLRRSPSPSPALSTSAAPAPLPSRLPIPDPLTLQRSIPFQQPAQIGSFSYSPIRSQLFDDSALSYYVDPPPRSDLGHRYEHYIERDQSVNEHLDGLVYALMEIGGRPGGDDVRRRAAVVTWRGMLTRLVTAIYERRDGWKLNVMMLDGTLYIEDALETDDLEKRQPTNPQNRIFSYYGYAFESYCTSSLPPDRVPPQEARERAELRKGWGDDVNTNVQWCSIVKTTLGSTRMILGGEVDCVKGKYTEQPDTYVELKTSMAITNQRQEENFERKLLKFWAQSFLLGIPTITVGFRDPSGRLTTTQHLQTLSIPRLVRGKPHAWDAAPCLAFASQTLEFLRAQVVRDPSAVWRAEFDPRARELRVRALGREERSALETGDEMERVGFLPKRYVDWVEERRGDKGA